MPIATINPATGETMKEFEARNRLEGESIFLDFSMPLWVNMPPGGGS